MTSREKLGRNDQCPCGSGAKYKRCCAGTVPWGDLVAKPFSAQLPFITARGRNLLFLNALADALQLDTLPVRTNFAEIKAAFTPKAVLKINEAVIAFWPNQDDCASCLHKERDHVTALYCGNYQPGTLLDAIRRHALYSDKILFADPFPYPLAMAEKYSPLHHPEQHRSTTAKWTYLWLVLAPWIDADLITFIRTPAEFDLHEYHEILQIQREKFANHPELGEHLRQEIKSRRGSFGPLDNDIGEYFILAASDEHFRKMYRDAPRGAQELTEDGFLAYIHERRRNHPYYLEPLGAYHSELLLDTCGANYEAAKRACTFTNSHLVTDLRVRWKEIEFDHQHATGNTASWSPFAKALQNAGLRVLEKAPLEAALRLRKENRLEQLRNFFNRVWRACREPDPYSETNAANLAAELDERIQEAKAEWTKIDKDLLKWMGPAMASVFVNSTVGFVPAAAAATAAIVAGGTALAVSTWQRASFKSRFPAGFFLGIET